MQYNTSYNELVLSFANNVNTPDGGTHEEGFRSSLTRVFNDYGRSHGLLKGQGREPVRLGRAGGPDLRHLGQAAGSRVRRPDQGQAGQHRDPHHGLQHGVQPA